jgi:hypothetical protein
MLVLCALTDYSQRSSALQVSQVDRGEPRGSQIDANVRSEFPRSIIHIAMALCRFGERGIGRHFDLGRSIWLTGRYDVLGTKWQLRSDDLFKPARSPARAYCSRKVPQTHRARSRHLGR